MKINVRRAAMAGVFVLVVCSLTVFALNGGCGERTREPDLQTAEQNTEASPPGKAVQKNEADSHAAQKDSEKQTETAASGAVSADQQTESTYFADALFIGDSRTEGFRIQAGLTEAAYLTAKGLNIKDVFEKPLVQSSSGTKITIAEAVKEKPYGKYYIMLGANELGWVYTDVFTEKYGQLIDLIREANPDAVIYVQSILPVTSEKSQSDAIYNNVNIARFNQLIEAMAAEKQVQYLNVGEAVSNEDGALEDEATTDGVHLNKEYCQKWLEYLKKHVTE